LRIAFISDIHGNLTALQAVLESIYMSDIDQTICLGDIIGYGARSNECVELISSKSIKCVLGNHEYAIINLNELSRFNPKAKESILWTKKNLSNKSMEFLKNLKLTLEVENIQIVHSSPVFPESWSYLKDKYQAKKAFKSFTQEFCIIGHTHQPVIFEDHESQRKLINAGSVGQPRDGNPKACWLWLDTRSKDFGWERVEYDIKKTAGEILDAKLPKFHAQRLFSGH